MGWNIYRRRRTAPPTRSERIDRWHQVAVVGACVLAVFVTLAGLMPPQPARRVAATWGAGAGALAFAALVLAGWRLGAWFFYAAHLALMLLVGAIAGTTAAGIWIALFDPPPAPADPAVLLRDSLR